MCSSGSPRKRGMGILLVTSDREIAGFAEKKGAKVLPVWDFAEKMEMAEYFAAKGSAGEDRSPDRAIAPEKKGPSRRLSKVPAENDLRRQKTIGVRQPGCRDKRAERRNHPAGLRRPNVRS